MPVSESEGIMRSRTLIGVWLDSSKALIVTLKGDDTSIEKIESEVETKERVEGEGRTFGRFGNQFVDDQKSKENRLHDLEARFLERVINSIRSADQLLIFGPAHMKQLLEKKVRNETANVPNIRAVKAADAMTDNQVAAYVREFFGKSASAPGFS